MLKIFFVTVLFFAAATVVYCQGDVVLVANIKEISTSREGDALHCNIFDANDVQNFDRKKCSSIRVTMDS